MNDTNLQTAVFNKLTKAQYEEKLNNNEINDNEFYMIVDANQMEFSNVESETGVTLKTIKIGNDIWKLPSNQNAPVDLSNYYTKAEVYNKDETYTRTEIDALVGNIPDLTGYATETWVEGKGYLTEQSLNTLNVVRTSDLTGYTTKEEFNSLSSDVTNLKLAGHVTETWVNEQGFAKTADVVTKGEFTEFIGAAPEALDTIHEIAAALEGQDDTITAIETTIGQKANSADVYTKTEIDQTVTTLEGSIQGVEDKVPTIVYSETEPESPVQGMIWLSDTASSGGSTGGGSTSGAAGGGYDFSNIAPVVGTLQSNGTYITSQVNLKVPKNNSYWTEGTAISYDLSEYIANGAKALYVGCARFSNNSTSNTVANYNVGTPYFNDANAYHVHYGWKLIPLNIPFTINDLLAAWKNSSDGKYMAFLQAKYIPSTKQIDMYVNGYNSSTESGDTNWYAHYFIFVVY